MHFINAAHAKHCFPAGTIFRLSAGQTGLVMHDFRHCYVTHKRRQGHDRSIIKKQVGHHSDSMFEWYNDIEDYELQEMAGYTKRNLDVLETEVSELLRKAKAAEIPLGAVQSLIGRLWNVKVER
jgi:integrase